MRTTDQPDPAPDLTAPELADLLGEALGAAFRDYTAMVQSARADLYALTMSGLGGCTRQAAYRLGRVAPSEPLVWQQMREADIGTMIHLGLLPKLAARTGGVSEVAVTLRLEGVEIDGHSDLYSAVLRAVVDLKTSGTYKFALLSDVINRAHLFQVAGYGLAHRQAGHAVDWIAWIYLDRSSGAEHIVVQALDDELVEQVRVRVEELVAYAAQPDAAPRDERGPGLSIICDSCPWLRACWGEDAEPGIVGAQRILVHDHAGVADALRLYDQARARESAAKADKEFFRAMFEGYPVGVYGEWEYGYSGAGQTDDKDAAVATLLAAGLPVPRKATTRRLLVKRNHSQR